MRGHEEASGIKYVPKDLLKKWAKKDPVKLFEKKIIKENFFSNEEIEKIQLKINNKINSSISTALDSDFPTSSESKELNDVYSEGSDIEIKPTKETHNIRYVDAIKETLYDLMSADKKTILMGQDIAEYGGVFKVTEGFVDKFGKDRIRNTPIIESGIIGASLGLTLEGFKPIIEMQFADFISCGINQVINNLAKTHYRWGHAVNVTIRMPSGGGVSAGPFHSQNLESLFMHIPGLKVVYPSSPYDAKGLLTSAINDSNPVLFFEHKLLYRTQKQDVPKELYSLAIGEANIIKEGHDITIITYGLSTIWIKEILNDLDTQEIDIELIDLRTLMPWDKKLVYKSIKKTNRVLVVHEANEIGGVGAEIAASISSDLFEFLDAPVERLGSIHTPTPFSQDLEQEIFWPKNKILKTIQKTIRY